MSNTTLFKFKDHDVRVIDLVGKPWYVASDVCRSIDIHVTSNGAVNTTEAVKKLDADEVGFCQIEVNHIVGTRRVKHRIVSQSGLYKLVMRSDRPEAQEFQNWIARVVLPAIGSEGGYILGEERVVSERSGWGDDRRRTGVQGHGGHRAGLALKPVQSFFGDLEWLHCCNQSTSGSIPEASNRLASECSRCLTRTYKWLRQWNYCI